MKTYNRYIFTVKCNINGEICKMLINAFIIRNGSNDEYISDNIEKYINRMLKEYFDVYTDMCVSYENFIKYTFQGRYESNIDLNFIINDIVYCYDEVEKYIDCKFTNAVTNNIKLYEDKVKEWNNKNYDNFELVYTK